MFVVKIVKHFDQKDKMFHFLVRQIVVYYKTRSQQYVARLSLGVSQAAIKELQWIGHVHCMEKKRIPLKALHNEITVKY